MKRVEGIDEEIRAKERDIKHLMIERKAICRDLAKMRQLEKDKSNFIKVGKFDIFGSRYVYWHLELSTNTTLGAYPSWDVLHERYVPDLLLVDPQDVAPKIAVPKDLAR